MLKRTYIAVCVCILATLVNQAECNTPFRAEHHTGLPTNIPDNTTLHDPLNPLAAPGDPHVTVGHTALEEGGGFERYPVVVVDFERVQTPFIIGLWIFLACLGKIGK